MSGIGAAMGTTLKIGANTVGELKSISGISLSAETIETTTLESTDGYRTYVGGLRDGGEVSVSGNFDSSDSTGQLALVTALNAGTSTAMTIVFPTAIGYTWTFNGIVTGVSTGADMDDVVTFDATIKVTGKPALAATGA